MNNPQNKRKTALITGASKGIGLAIAKAFAEAGYDLALCCRTNIDMLDAEASDLMSPEQAAGSEVSDKTKQEGVSVSSDESHQATEKARILCYKCDVSSYEAVTEMVQDILDHFGRIDVLVNNAGIAHVGLFQDMTPGEWRNVLGTNLDSVYNCCHAVLPGLILRHSGRIINISSVWGVSGASCEVAYSASKGGMNALTRALAKELAPSGIAVNAIACGAIDTDMNSCFTDEEKADIAEEIPAGRFGRPEEVADLALSLAEGTDYLTGQVINLDGGWI